MSDEDTLPEIIGEHISDTQPESVRLRIGTEEYELHSRLVPIENLCALVLDLRERVHQQNNKTPTREARGVQ